MTDWRDEAAYRTEDPEWFFPDSRTPEPMVAAALAVCGRCTARRECLAEALRKPRQYGVWGGLTEDQRADLKGAK